MEILLLEKLFTQTFLDEDGGVHADLTISRLAENKYRIVTGGADGNRDWVHLRNYRDDNGLNARYKYSYS